LSGALLGLRHSEIERKFDEIVEFAGVAPFIDTPVKFYSSGMYVRLAFAVGANLNPTILIIDEVLGVGDSAFQQKCLGRMNEVAKEGRTVLFVSHSASAVRALCTRGILLHEGKIATIGDPPTISRLYLGLAGAHPTERSWTEAESPGNDELRLRRVRLRAASGDEPGRLTPQSAFRMEVDFAVLRDGLLAGVMIRLGNQDDVHVLQTISNTDPTWHGRPLPAGHFRSVCNVPANLLNAGHYRVAVVLWKDNYVTIAQEVNLLGFDVHDTAEGRGGYFGIWDGAVRPHLDWVTRRLDASEPVAAVDYQDLLPASVARPM
jgi:lipopolysaccharide transport system ATP-binding protein